MAGRKKSKSVDQFLARRDDPPDSEFVDRCFDFPEALRRMKDDGAKVVRYTERRGFVFGGRVSGLEAPGVALAKTIVMAPCLFRCDEHGVCHAGWQPTAEDMLAQDWVELAKDDGR